MKKVYKIEVDCPTCASKLEKCCKEMDGVEACSVNLMTQKLSVSAPAEKQKEIMQALVEKMKKVDDDIVIYC